MNVKRIAVAMALSLTATVMPATAAQPAASYPTRPVRWVVPFPPGASNDITARLLAHVLRQFLRQPTVIRCCTPIRDPASTTS